MNKKLKIYGENGENQSQMNSSVTKKCFKSQRPGLPADKFAKRATCEFFSALFLLLVGSGPKRSMPIEKLGSFLLVSSIFQRDGKRPCVNKDFVHSGSIGLIVELAERSPVIIQNSSNPSSRKNLDLRPYDRTKCYF